MDIHKMIGQATQILTEERQRPTINYGQNQDIIYKSAKNNPVAIDAVAFFRSLGIPHVFKLREQNPRLVYEKPEHYLFSGTNFDLLNFTFQPRARSTTS